MNALVIRKTILAELAGAAPYALPADQLRRQVNILLRPQLTEEQLMDYLSWLLDRQLINFIPDELDPEDAGMRKWLIKERGQAALMR